MIRIRVRASDASVKNKIKEAEANLDAFLRYFLNGLANDIVMNSPVDTGTYVTSHVFSLAPVAGNVSSHGKPRNQDWSAKAQEGLNNLVSDINSFGDLRQHKTFWLSNISAHADIVEYEHGYNTYTTTKSRRNVIAAEAARRAAT